MWISLAHLLHYSYNYYITAFLQGPSGRGHIAGIVIAVAESSDTATWCQLGQGGCGLVCCVSSSGAVHGAIVGNGTELSARHYQGLPFNECVLLI